MLFRLVFATILLCAPIASLANATASDLLKDVKRNGQTVQITKTYAATQIMLPNGLTVFLTENTKAPTVSVGHWVKAGSLHEKPGITGIAHLFEHMMFRPLKAGAPSFFELSTKLGGQANANTRFEGTYFGTTAPVSNLKALLKLESDRFKNLVVTKDLLDVERKAVWSEYSTKFDSNPVIDLWFQIYQQAYVGHPFGWMIIGDRGDLEKITADDCNTFFQRYYRPNNTGLFVTGNFKTDEILPTIVEFYGDWEKGVDSQLPEPFKGKTKEISAEGKLPSQANLVLFGFRTPYFNAQNAALQTIVAEILFDSKAGLLKKRMVDEARIAASVSEFNFSYDNGMLKAAIVALPTTKLSQIKAELAKVPADLAQMSDTMFAAYKRNVYVSMAESIQRNSELGDLLALSWGKFGNVALASAFVTGPVEIKKEDVQKFMTEYFKPDNFIYMTHKGQGK